MMKSRIRQNSISGFSPAILFSGRAGSFTLMIMASCLLMLGLVRPQLMSDVRLAAVDVMSPVLLVFTQPFQNMAEALGSVSGVTSIRAENAKLKAENTRLKEWYQTALMLQAENQSLQELLNLKVDPAHNFITGRVISDAGNTYVKTILVALGQDDGIKKNQAVLAGEGLIGRIIETGNKTSRILLLNDINSRIPVLIEGSSQKAILAGNNLNFPTLKHLPQDAGVLDGARVVTSGNGGVFPAGLPIGRIVKGDKDEIIVKTYADMNKVVFVRVIDNFSNNNLISADQQSLLQ